MFSLHLAANEQDSNYALENLAWRSYMGSGHLRVGPDLLEELLGG